MILGIESSCDESALALFDEQRGLVGEWVLVRLGEAWRGLAYGRDAGECYFKFMKVNILIVGGV